MKSNVINKLCKISIIIYSVFMFFILIVETFFSSNINFANKNNIVQNNWMYILLGILFLILLFNFSKFVSNKFNEKIPKLIITLSVIFGFLMVVSALSIWFFNTNDPMEIQIAANSIVNNEPILNNNYFSTYPNNLLILLINSLIFKITDLFNISIFNSKILVIINCILISIVSLLIPKIVKLLNFPVEYQFFSYLLFVIFIGFSPWNIIFYSDIFGIFLITLIIFLFLKYIGNSKNIYIYILVFLCFQVIT